MPRTNVAATFSSMQWAILPEKLNEIAAIVERFEEGLKINSEEARMLIENSVHVVDAARHGVEGGAGDSSGPQPEVISVLGTLMNRTSAMSQISGATTYNGVAQRVLAAAANPEVSKIVLDMDTPGGTVVGVDVLAGAVRQAAKIKPVIAVVNDMAASAGYWVASQATQIVASRSSIVGSISVIATHQDVTALEEKVGMKTTVLTTGKYKGLGHPSQALSAEHKAKIEERIGRTHRTFVETIAAGRGLSEKDANRLATGETWDGEEAVENGLIDSIASIQEVLERDYKTSAPTAVYAATTPKAMDTEAQAELDALKASMASLKDTVTTLVEVSQTMAASQKEQADQARLERAQSLVNPLVRSGAVLPSAAAGLIQQATDNYELVKSTLDAANLTASASVPLDNVIGDAIQGNPRAQTGAQAEVFEQLGLMGFDGKVNLANVTLGLNQNGAMASTTKDEVYSSERVVPQVKAQLGSWLA